MDLIALAKEPLELKFGTSTETISRFGSEFNFAQPFSNGKLSNILMKNGHPATGVVEWRYDILMGFPRGRRNALTTFSVKSK